MSERIVTPHEIKEQAEDKLSRFVNKQLRKSAKQLYNGETLTIEMESPAEMKWAERNLSDYCVKTRYFVTQCKHVCDEDCFNEDNESICLCRRTDDCDCRKTHYVVDIRLNKDLEQ